MKPSTVLAGVLSGCVLIALGLIPGLLQDLANGVRNFRDSFSSSFQVTLPYQGDCKTSARPIWLAGLGSLLIVVSLLAYFSN
jgi:hypothetical protein